MGRYKRSSSGAGAAVAGTGWTGSSRAAGPVPAQETAMRRVRTAREMTDTAPPEGSPPSCCIPYFQSSTLGS
jgi:hypothetical protein